MNQLIVPIPDADPGDAEDVVSALETANVFGAKGEAKEAIRWLRRAAQSASENGQDVRSAALARAAADLSDRFARPLPPPLPAAPATPPPLPRTAADATPSPLPLVTKAPEPARRDDVGTKTLESAGAPLRGTAPPPAPSARAAKTSDAPRALEPAKFPQPPVNPRSPIKTGENPRASTLPTQRPSSLSLGLNGKAGSAFGDKRPSTINGSLSAKPSSSLPTPSVQRPSTGTPFTSSARKGSVLPSLNGRSSSAPASSHETPTPQPVTVATAPVHALEAKTPALTDEPTPLKSPTATTPHHHALRVAVTPTERPGIYEMRVLRLGELVLNGSQEGLLVLLAPDMDLARKQ